MNLKTIVIDSYKTFGSTMLLVSVKPYYDYANGVKSSEISGYKYECCRKTDLEKFAIKIAGKQLVEAPASGYVEVKFTDLSIGLYQSNNEVKITSTASNIALVNTNK